MSVLRNKSQTLQPLLSSSCFLLFDFTVTASSTGVAVLLSLSLLTVVLNSLVIMTIWKDPFKNLKIISSCLIVNLAIADFLLGIPGMLLFALPHWFSSDSTLKTAADITLHLVCYTSGLTILALAVERLIVISFPLKMSDYLTYTHLTLTILCIWLFAGLLAFLPLLEHDSFDRCRVVIADAVVFLIIMSLFACYTRIFFLVRKNLYRDLTTGAGCEERQCLTENAREREKIKRRERRVAFSLFILVGLFVVCWTPVIVLENLNEFCGSCIDSAKFQMALRTLILLHPLVNPIAYSLRTVKFQRALWRIFCKSNRDSPRRPYV